MENASEFNKESIADCPQGFLAGTVIKNLPVNAGDTGDVG